MHNARNKPQPDNNELHNNKANQIKILSPSSNPTPDRLCHNILDTFLYRIRTEILDESKHMHSTQNKTDNLTRKEWLVFKQTIQNDTIEINKVDKSSMVVVEDRKHYINNTMTQTLTYDIITQKRRST